MTPTGSPPRLTSEQIVAAFHAMRIVPRDSDLELMGFLGATSHTVAEYIWDHWLGEPESPSLDQVHLRIRKVLRP